MSGPWDYLPEIFRLRELVATGERVGPRLLTAGPVLDGPGPGSGRETDVIVNSADEAQQAVRRVKRDGADFVKVLEVRAAPDSHNRVGVAVGAIHDSCSSSLSAEI